MSLLLLGVGGRAFDPLSVSPYQWLDADVLTSLWQDTTATTPVAASNDVVKRWDDLSGNNRHFLQATTGKAALYQAGLLNGHAVVDSDLTDDIMATASGYSLSTGFIISVLFRQTSNPDDGGKIFGRNQAGVTWPDYEIEWNGPMLGSDLPRCGMGGSAGDFRVATGTTVASVNSNYVMTGTWNGSNVTVRLNGAQQGSTAATNYNNGTDVNHLFRGVDGAGFASGTAIQSLIVCPFSAANLAAVEGYHLARGGI